MYRCFCCFFNVFYSTARCLNCTEKRGTSQARAMLNHMPLESESKQHVCKLLNRKTVQPVLSFFCNCFIDCLLFFNSQKHRDQKSDFRAFVSYLILLHDSNNSTLQEPGENKTFDKSTINLVDFFYTVIILYVGLLQRLGC